MTPLQIGAGVGGADTFAITRVLGELPLKARTWVQVVDLGDDPRKQVRKAEGESQWRKPEATA